MNPTEGLWCNQKQYIRKRTDQTFIRLHKLLVDSRVHFSEKQMCQKLMPRFWNCIEAYEDCATYFTIMSKYFSGKSTGKNIAHTKISNSQLA